MSRKVEKRPMLQVTKPNMLQPKGKYIPQTGVVSH